MIEGLTNESKAWTMAACGTVVPAARASRLRMTLAVGGFCLLAALAAQVRIPVPGTAIPMTLQAPAILLAAFLLPPWQAIASSALYLGLGAAGLPVFAPGSLGLAGPTGGFLVGFVVCAGLVGALRGRGEASVVRLFMAGLAGYVGLFALGLTWYGFWTGDLATSIRTGLPPFLPKAVVEIGLTVGLARVGRSVLIRLAGSKDPETPVVGTRR